MNRFSGAALALTVCLPMVAVSSSIPGNADRGQQVFASRQCGSCHAVGARGGKTGPDLTKMPEGRFTPAALAQGMWNHGPVMSQAMEKAGMAKADLSPQEAADLYAYLFSLRHFEGPGDAARGKMAFDSKGCIACHGEGVGIGPPVTKWETISDPIQLARAMWNHAPAMKSALSADMTWPELTAQEMADLLASVRGTPGVPKAPAKLAAASAETGEALFKAKGCENCHSGAQSLAGRMSAQTLVGLAASMWNHAPQMRDSAFEIRPEEMTRLVGYLWSIQYFDEAGDPAKGVQTAVSKSCIECHGQLEGSAPRFTSMAGNMDALRFISGAWNHAAGMQDALKQAGKEWPKLDRAAVNDLVAYINSL